MQVASQELEKRVFQRLLWFIMPAMLIAFMDRINISFAAPTMNPTIGIDGRTFGLGAGIFFLGYLMLEIPSNMMLARVGARFWISRIMVVWGIVAAAMSLAVGPWSFLSLRFLLGVAEAGFLPGVMLYATYWVAPKRLGTFNSWMLLAIPLAGSITALLSGVILRLDGIFGLHGWQWIFIVEGAPAVLLGLYGLVYVPSYPRDAKWLTDAEKTIVEEGVRPELSRGPMATAPMGGPSLARRILGNPQIMLLAVAYLFMNCALGAQPWLPLLFAQHKPSPLTVPLVLGAGNLLAALAMLAWGRASDRAQERSNHLLMSACVSAFGWFLCGYGEASEMVLGLGIGLALIGLYASLVVFWAIPAACITEEERPVGIALITCVGLIGSFVAPIATGWLKDWSGSYAGGMYIAVVGILVSALLTRLASRRTVPMALASLPKHSASN